MIAEIAFISVLDDTLGSITSPRSAKTHLTLF